MNAESIHLFPVARADVHSLEASKIRAVSNAGAGIEGVIPLWFGEPDEVTPDFVRDAAKAALDAGATFYGPNLGIRPLRDAIARYQQGLGRRLDLDRVVVTSSGVSALMLCCQALIAPGDRVVVPTPHWPHLAEIPKICGAEVVHVPLRMVEGRWQADLDGLLTALTPGTRMAVINSPANPTGWTLTRDEQEALLTHCRRHGIWILADEVYDRLSFDGHPAPSFLDLAGADDRVLSVNSFSKSWAMTGWRLGWIVAPPAMADDFAKLNEYNVSSPTTFVQHAGIAALQQGEPFIARTIRRYAAARDLAVKLLDAVPQLSVPIPAAGMYVLFQVEGCTDSVALAQDILVRARVGMAPGAAFGSAGEGCLRMCFAGSTARIEEACSRLIAYFSSK